MFKKTIFSCCLFKLVFSADDETEKIQKIYNNVASKYSMYIYKVYFQLIVTVIFDE